MSSPETHFAPEDKDSDIINQSDGGLHLTLTHDKGRNNASQTFQEPAEKGSLALAGAARDGCQRPSLLGAHRAVQESKLGKSRDGPGTDDELEFPLARNRPVLQLEAPSASPDDAATGKRRQSAHSGAVPGSAGDQQQIGSQSDFDPEQLERDKVGGESLGSSSPLEPGAGIQKQPEAVSEPGAPLQERPELSEQERADDAAHDRLVRPSRIGIDQNGSAAEADAAPDSNPSPINLR